VEVEITGRHMEVTEPMARHINDHVEKLPRFDERIQYMTVMLDMDNGNALVEIIAKCHRTDLVAEARGHDMYQSIDEAFAKMRRQINRLHDKIVDHGNKTA
jgi:putative sigma-54 modulation protein